MSNKRKNITESFADIRNAITKLLRFLRIRSSAGGLEITDQMIRLAYFERSSWQFRAVRMEPGIVEGGKIIDEAAFVAALTALRAKAPKRSQGNGTLNVVVSLGAASIYNQIFNLPLIRGASFETAMKLNLQMSSSVDSGETYSGWEIISTNESLGRVEVLGAFTSRTMIDSLTTVLFAAGFVATAIESKALAIARTIREYGSGLDPAASYLVIVIDDSGMDFIIVRHGHLCFEYMGPLRDMADEKGEISLDKFRQMFSLNLHQVMNFYRQHWTDQLTAIGLSGSVLMDEVRTLIAASNAVPIFSLSDALGASFDDAWAVALGSGLRGMDLEEKVGEIDFLGAGAKKIFEDNRILEFLSFWRIVVPVVFVALIAVFVSTDIFLRTAGKSALQYATAAANENANTSRSAAALISQESAFNSSVALIAALESSSASRSALMSAISSAATGANITITRVTFQAGGVPLLVAGQSQSEGSISAFKSAVAQIPGVSAVNLPLEGIQGSGSSYSFSLMFSWSGASAGTP